MTSFGPRRSPRMHPPGAQPDLARRAVAGGGVLTLVLVVLAYVTGFWGGTVPAADPPAATSAAASLGSELEPAKSGGGRSGSDSDSHSDEDSDSDRSGSDSGKSGKSGDSGGSGKSGKSGKSGSGKSGKKHGSASSSSTSSSPSSSPSSSGDGAGVLAGLGDAFSPGGGTSTSFGGGSSSRVLPPNFSVPTRRPAAGSLGPVGRGANPDSDPDSDSHSDPPGGDGGGYTRPARSSTTCTTMVSDRAALDRELRDIGPEDVVCVRGGSAAGGLSGRSAGLPDGFGSGITDADRTTSPSVARSSASGSRGTPSYVGPGRSSGNITLGPVNGSGDRAGRCTREVTDSAGFERALKDARDGDKVCIGVGDLGVRLEVGKGGASGLSIQIAGLGALSSKGLTVQTDAVQAEHNNIGRITTR